MRKKVTGIVVALLLLSSVGFASPLTDYSRGKIAIDFALRPSGTVTMKAPNWSDVSFPGGTSNFDFGLTVGLGKKFAFQYRNSQGDSAEQISDDGDLSFFYKARAQEFNILYKINNNISAFAGVVSVVPGFTVTREAPGVNSISSNINSTTGYQLGIVGITKIAKKATAYGVIGFGNTMENYEIGLGYEIVKNLELNIGYRRTTYKNITIDPNTDGDGGGTYSHQFSGFSYGATYKFQ